MFTNLKMYKKRMITFVLVFLLVVSIVAAAAETSSSCTGFLEKIGCFIFGDAAKRAAVGGQAWWDGTNVVGMAPGVIPDNSFLIFVIDAKTTKNLFVKGGKLYSDSEFKTPYVPPQKVITVSDVTSRTKRTVYVESDGSAVEVKPVGLMGKEPIYQGGTGYYTNKAVFNGQYVSTNGNVVTVTGGKVASELIPVKNDKLKTSQPVYVPSADLSKTTIDDQGIPRGNFVDAQGKPLIVTTSGIVLTPARAQEIDTLLKKSGITAALSTVAPNDPKYWETVEKEGTLIEVNGQLQFKPKSGDTPLVNLGKIEPWISPITSVTREPEKPLDLTVLPASYQVVPSTTGVDVTNLRYSPLGEVVDISSGTAVSRQDLKVIQGTDKKPHVYIVATSQGRTYYVDPTDKNKVYFYNIETTKYDVVTTLKYDSTTPSSPNLRPILISASGPSPRPPAEEPQITIDAKCGASKTCTLASKVQEISGASVTAPIYVRKKGETKEIKFEPFQKPDGSLDYCAGEGCASSSNPKVKKHAPVTGGEKIFFTEPPMSALVAPAPPVASTPIYTYKVANEPKLAPLSLNLKVDVVAHQAMVQQMQLAADKGYVVQGCTSTACIMTLREGDKTYRIAIDYNSDTRKITANEFDFGETIPTKNLVTIVVPAAGTIPSPATLPKVVSAPVVPITDLFAAEQEVKTATKPEVALFGENPGKATIIDDKTITSPSGKTYVKKDDGKWYEKTPWYKADRKVGEDEQSQLDSSVKLLQSYQGTVNLLQQQRTKQLVALGKDKTASLWNVDKSLTSLAGGFYQLVGDNGVVYGYEKGGKVYNLKEEEIGSYDARNKIILLTDPTKLDSQVPIGAVKDILAYSVAPVPVPTPEAKAVMSSDKKTITIEKEGHTYVYTHTPGMDINIESTTGVYRELPVYASKDGEKFVHIDGHGWLEVYEYKNGWHFVAADGTTATDVLSEARKSDHLTVPPTPAPPTVAPAPPTAPPIPKKALTPAQQKDLDDWNKGLELTIPGLPGDGQVKLKNGVIELDCGSICTNEGVRVNPNSGDVEGWDGIQSKWVTIPETAWAQVPDGQEKQKVDAKRVEIQKTLSVPTIVSGGENTQYRITTGKDGGKYVTVITTTTDTSEECTKDSTKCEPSKTEERRLSPEEANNFLKQQGESGTAGDSAESVTSDYIYGNINPAEASNRFVNLKEQAETRAAAATTAISTADAKIAEANAVISKNEATKEEKEKATADKAIAVAERTKAEGEKAKAEGEAKDAKSKVTIYDVLSGIQGIGAVVNELGKLGKYQGISNLLFPETTQEWNRWANNEFFNTWADIPGRVAREACEYDQKKRAERAGEGVSFIHTPTGAYQFVGSIQAEKTTTVVPVMCEKNPDENATEEFICSDKQQVCVNNLCYKGTDPEEIDPDVDKPATAILYKVHWGVSAPQDLAWTPFVDENGIAVRFNLGLYTSTGGNVNEPDKWVFKKSGSAPLSVIELKNGAQDGGTIVKYLAEEYVRTCVVFNPEYNVKDDEGDYVNQICANFKDISEKAVEYGGGGASTASTTSTSPEVEYNI
ncbi:MAG: hypothetical protein V2A62_01200 [Candidatus Woesearchaeota archaeon]